MIDFQRDSYDELYKEKEMWKNSFLGLQDVLMIAVKKLGGILRVTMNDLVSVRGCEMNHKVDADLTEEFWIDNEQI